MDPALKAHQAWDHAIELEIQIFAALPAYLESLRINYASNEHKMHLVETAKRLLISRGANAVNNDYSFSASHDSETKTMIEPRKMQHRELAILLLLSYLERELELQRLYFGTSDDLDLDYQEKELQNEIAVLNAQKVSLSASTTTEELLTAQNSKIEVLRSDIALIRRKIASLIFMVSKLTNSSQRVSQPVKDWLALQSHLLQLESS